MLGLLASVSYPGRDQVAAQSAVARVVDEEVTTPSVVLFVPGDVPLVLDELQEPRIGVIPAELSGSDVDGMMIGVVLACRDGVISYLDVHRFDGEELREVPDPHALSVHFRS